MTSGSIVNVMERTVSFVGWTETLHVSEQPTACWRQDAAERIRRGAAALKERLAQDDAHYQQVAELQRGWKIRRAQPPLDRFYVDLSLRPSLAEPEPRALIDIIRVMLPSLHLCRLWCAVVDLC